MKLVLAIIAVLQEKAFVQKMSASQEEEEQTAGMTIQEKYNRLLVIGNNTGPSQAAACAIYLHTLFKQVVVAEL